MLRIFVAFGLMGSNMALGSMAQSEVELQSNPGWGRVRALIEWHALGEKRETVAAIWMRAGGEECTKALLAEKVPNDAAQEICSSSNPQRQTAPQKRTEASKKDAPPNNSGDKPVEVRQSSQTSNSPSSSAIGSKTGEPLTNEIVVRILKAGIGESILVNMIESQPGNYLTKPDDLIALKTAGASDLLIQTILTKSQSNRSPVTTTLAPDSGVKQVLKDEPFVLHDGTPVKLRLGRNLSSADAKAGESVDFEVLEEVRLQDAVVIARGATAIATVTKAESKRRMARGGKLDVNIDYVRLRNGEKVALRAIRETKGGGHSGAMTGGIVATAIVFFPAAPLFLFMHGKDVTIPKGTEITAYLSGEVVLDRSKFSVQ